MKQSLYTLMLFLMVQGMIPGMALSKGDPAGPPGITLETISAESHPGYTSLVFQFSERVSFEEPILGSNAAFIRLKGVKTGLPPYRQFLPLNTSITLEKVGGDIRVRIGLPETFQRLIHFLCQYPPRLVVNLFTEERRSSGAPAEEEEPQLLVEGPPVFSPGPGEGNDNIEEKAEGIQGKIQWEVFSSQPMAKEGPKADAGNPSGESETVPVLAGGLPPWYPVEDEDGRIAYGPLGQGPHSPWDPVSQSGTGSIPLEAGRKDIPPPAMDDSGPEAKPESASVDTGHPIRLEAVRAAAYRAYYRIVFEFSSKFRYEPPVLKGNEISLMLKNVIPSLPPFQPQPPSISWVKWREAGADLDVQIGLKEPFSRINCLIYKDPDRLVLNLFKEETSPPVLPAKTVVGRSEGRPYLAVSPGGFMDRAKGDDMGWGGPVLAKEDPGEKKAEGKDAEKPAAEKPKEAAPAASGTTEPPKTPEPPVKMEPIDTDAKIVITSSNDQLMSINFLDVDIRKALSALAMERDVNIATASNVDGRVSVHLTRATLDEALNAITLAGGYEYLQNGELYYVYRPKEVKDPYAGRLEMRIFKIKMADVEKIDEMIRTISGIRTVKLHKDSKTIMVEDTPENIKKIEKVISYWDTLPKQVLIEAKILEIGLTDDMSLGVNWRDILGDVTLETGGFTRTALPITVPNSALSIATGTGVFANLIKAAGAEQQFTIALDALKTKTTVNALSTPKILAIHGKPARVQVGGKQGYRVTTSNQGVSTETINFIDTGTILDITPYIDDEKNVLLQVKPTISSVELGPTGIPNVSNREVSTWLLSRNGETVFIGGLLNDTETKSKEFVPCLGGIPGLGLFFGRTSKTYRKTELVILITPTVLDVEEKRVDQESLDMKKKMEEMMKKRPLPHHKELYDFLFK